MCTGFFRQANFRWTGSCFHNGALEISADETCILVDHWVVFLKAYCRSLVVTTYWWLISPIHGLVLSDEITESNSEWVSGKISLEWFTHEILYFLVRSNLARVPRLTFAGSARWDFLISWFLAESGEEASHNRIMKMSNKVMVLTYSLS
jgi:hypothetical protein